MSDVRDVGSVPRHSSSRTRADASRPGGSDTGSRDTRLDHWCRELRDAVPVALALDRARTHPGEYKAAFARLRVPEPVVVALRTIAQQHDAAIADALVAAWNALLSRHTGHVDVVVACPQGEGEGVSAPAIGSGPAIVAVRTDVSDDPTFIQLLERSERASRAARKHGPTPLELLRLTNDEDPAGLPESLLRMGLVFEGADTPDASDGAHKAVSRFEEAIHELGHLDVELRLRLQRTELTGDLRYNASIFDQQTIGNLGRRFEVLLAQIVERPTAPISALDMLPDSERAKLAAWNDTARAYPDGVCVHQLVEAQAARTPFEVAVCCENDALTYEELDAQANRLAHYLIGLGVGPEVRVGVCLERSLNTVVALLAVLKAGGAYVPLDPPLSSRSTPVHVGRRGPACNRHRIRDRTRVGEPIGMRPSRCSRAGYSRAADEGANHRRDRSKPGVCHLHLRLDRAPKGRLQSPSRRLQPNPLASGHVSTRSQ